MKEKESLTLSASRIKTYQQCPRRYYYTYIEKLPRKEWDHFDLGTLVHGSLEFFHKSFKNDNEKGLNLKRLMKESFQKQKNIMDKKFTRDILLTARDLLLEYLQNIEDNGIGSNILNLEEKFDVKLDNICNIIGVVDRLDIDSDGIYHIKDYKTNKDMRYMEPDQLRIYGIYLLNKYPQVENFRGSYIMLKFGGKYISYNFNTDDVNKEKEKIKEYSRKIIEDERWVLKPSILCDWCDFKKICLNTW